MTLREDFAAKTAELAELETAIDAGDAEAIEKGAELAAELDALEETIKKADTVQAKLKAMNGGIKEEDMEETVMEEKATLGEIVAKAFDGKYVKGNRITLEKSATTFTTPAAIADYLTDYDKNIVGVRQPLRIEQLFGHETVSGNAITYLVEGADEGGAAVVAEGAQKPQWSTSYTAVTDSLKKIAAFYKESDELLEDAAWLASNIDNKALYLHNIKREDWLLNDATNGLLARSGIGTASVAANPTATVLADAIFAAMMSVQEDSGFEADAILLNPEQYQLLRLGKDGESRYYGGGYFEGGMPSLWGVPTIVTPRVAAKTFVVGNFRQGASIFSKGGVRVEMTNSNEDDFEKNLVTVRVESRLGLAVRYPKAFVKGTIATS